jgi:hypothetical protein
MPKRDIDGTYVNRVMDVMFHQPTAQDIDFLVEAYAKVGYYTAVAEGQAAEAETAYKMAQADTFLRERMADPKATIATLEAKVTMETLNTLNEFTKAKSDYTKLRSLRDAVEQAINAIKFLERNGGVRIG